MNVNTMIGYGVRAGTFTNDKGEKIPYSNRLIRCITDSSETSIDVGFQAYEVKLKTEVIAQCLQIPFTGNLAVDETAVNKALDQLIQKAVKFTTAPVNGSLVVTGIYPATK